MGYSLKLLAVGIVLFITSPVEAAIADGLSVASEFVIAQGYGKKQGRDETSQLYQLGVQQYEKSQFKEALKTFEKVLGIYREIGDEVGEGKTLNKIGEIYINWEEYQKAKDLFEQALFISKKIGDKSIQGNAIGNLGVFYLSLGEYPKAQEFLEKALAINSSIKNQKGIGESLHNIGSLYYSLGEYPKALDYFQQSLAIEKQLGDKASKATTLNSIGGVYYSLGEYPKALDYLQQSLAIEKQIGNKAGVASTLEIISFINLVNLNELGLQHFNKGNSREALNNFEQALVIAREIGNSKFEGLILNAIGRVYDKLGKYPEALDYYQQSLAISKQLGDKAGEGTSLNNIGSVYHSLGEYSKALNYYQQSLAIDKQLGDKSGVAVSLAGIGIVYKSLGEYALSLDYYKQSLAIKKQIGDKAGVAVSLAGIGIVYKSLGEYALSLDYHQQSLAIGKQLGNKSGVAASLNNIGSVYNSLGEYRKALDFYQQSLAIVKQIGYKVGVAATLNNIGEVYKSLAEYIKALDYYQQALAINKEIGYKTGQGATLNNIGSMYNTLGEYLKALDYYQQSLAINKEIGGKAWQGTSLNNIGSVYKSLAEYPKALDYYQQALATVKQIGYKSGEAKTLNNIGLLYKQIGKYLDAEKTLFAAIDILESLREELTDDQKISIFDIQAKTYRFLQETLIAQNKTTIALEISERSKARALVELLSSKLNPNKQINIKPPQIEQIKQIAQQQKATFVEYSVIDKSQLYIWVIKPTGEVTFKQVDIKSTDTPLAKLVKNSRVSIGARRSAIASITATVRRVKQNRNSQKQNLQQLHKLLIEPIASHLPTNPEERVIFIPHESLFLVPFPALMDVNGKYLIEKHTIMTAPAIQVLELTNQNNQGKLNLSSLQPKDLLVVGNPTMPIVGIPPTQLSKLPGAEKEAKNIAKLFNTTPLIGNQATKSAVVQKISSARVIHLATHGLLDGKDFGELTPGAIALAPDIPTPLSLRLTKEGKRGVGVVNEGLLKTAEIIDMKLNADLVVLSACDTGRGEITGDGVIGLSRSLITAGASSVIVSLWKIPDNSTSDLMSEFYRQWEKTGDKAAALRTAMLKTMKNHRKPIHWAAFTLIGEAE